MSKEKRVALVIVASAVVLCIVFVLYSYNRDKVMANYLTNSEITTGDQAVAAVKETYPKYEDYPSDNLPIKTIEVVESEEGWRVGMYVMGSGLPGILSADCFVVTKAGAVIENGFFNGEGPATGINLVTCTPKE